MPALSLQVSQTSIKLQDMSVAVRCVGHLTVQQLQQSARHTLLLMSMPTSLDIYPAKSVVASLNCELVHVGNSVQFKAGPSEVSDDL